MTKSRAHREDVARGQLSLNPPGLFPLLLSRLFDHEVSALAPLCQAIEPDHFAYFSPSMMQREMALPRVFVAAQRVFGRSSSHFDLHKGSFQFSLLLSAVRAAVKLQYVLVLQDVRGSMRVTFHRLSEKPEPREHPNPVAGELSRLEVKLLSDALLEFLYIAGAAVARTISAVHRTVPSELIVYGCRNGDLFESRFEHPEEYERAVERIRRDLMEAEHREELEYVSRMLQDVTGDAPKAG